jgi:hypothetical protein
VSLQNGLNEGVIAQAVGADRVVGAFVNFGADVVAPGRILLGNRATFRIGELDGHQSARVDALAADIEDAEATANVVGYLWSKQAYGAMLFATAVSDLSIADALADPAYRRLFLALAGEMLDAAPVTTEPFDGFDPADLEGSIDRLAGFNRRSSKTHSGIYRDLAVRHRKTEGDAILGPVETPLVTHTLELIHAIEQGRRTCRRANLDLLNTFHRHPRSLVFWDESLLAAEGHSISKREIDSALAWLKSWVTRDDGALNNALTYLNECADWLNEELDAQKRDHRWPRRIQLPARSRFELELYSRVLQRPEAKPLTTLLTLGQRPLRVVPVSQGGGAVVTYDITVPRELDNVVVLDASYPIRQLERLDPSIQPAPNFNGAVKRYDKVVVNHLRHGCGRSAMERSFDEQDAEARLVSRELCDVIADIDSDEGVIVFTFKANNVDIREVLKRDLRAAGVDSRAMLKPASDNEEPKPRFRFLTWGQETGINDHSDCPNVVFAGVIHRSETDLAAAIVGQQDDLLAPVTGKQVVEARRSENAHALYQAMSRGACRETVDGQARPMRVWLIHYDRKLPALIDKVMPGVRWETWIPKFLDPIQTKVEALALQVLAYLRHLRPEITKVSTRVLRQTLGLSDIPDRTFTRVVRQVADADVGWSLYRRSLQRSTFGLTVNPI